MLTLTKYAQDASTGRVANEPGGGQAGPVLHSKEEGESKAGDWEGGVANDQDKQQ